MTRNFGWEFNQLWLTDVWTILYTIRGWGPDNIEIHCFWFIIIKSHLESKRVVMGWIEITMKCNDGWNSKLQLLLWLVLLWPCCGYVTDALQQFIWYKITPQFRCCSCPFKILGGIVKYLGHWRWKNLRSSLHIQAIITRRLMKWFNN